MVTMRARPSVGTLVCLAFASCAVTPNRSPSALTVPAPAVEPTGGPAVAPAPGAAAPPLDAPVVVPREGHTFVVGEYDAVGIATTAVIAAGLVPLIARGDTEAITDAGDWLQVLLPATGYVFAGIERDGKGALQLTASMATAGAFVHLTKIIPLSNRRNRP